VIEPSKINWVFARLNPFKKTTVKWALETTGPVNADRDKKLAHAIETIVGRKPTNLELYRLATRHVSVAKENMYGLKESNERLEFLGDAVLGVVVAEYLFKKYPYKDEGFLTEIRSRIVNREMLNQLARKIGVHDIVEYDKATRKGTASHKSINGDTLEALVGAVYIDRGFNYCKSFILERLIIPHFDIEEIVKSNHNYKSQVIEYAQKRNLDISFDTSSSNDQGGQKEFCSSLYIDDELMASGFGMSKKKAEQNAAMKALDMLSSDDDE
jgi:ribonuclease III